MNFPSNVCALSCCNTEFSLTILGKRAGYSGTANDYGLDGQGIESRWGGDFSACPDRLWGPHSLLYNGYRVIPGGKVRPGRAVDHSRPSSAEVYPPAGPHRACNEVTLYLVSGKEKNKILTRIDWSSAETARRLTERLSNGTV
jgi:hypothetical protein